MDGVGCYLSVEFQGVESAFNVYFSIEVTAEAQCAVIAHQGVEELARHVVECQAGIEVACLVAVIVSVKHSNLLVFIEYTSHYIVPVVFRHIEQFGTQCADGSSLILEVLRLERGHRSEYGVFLDHVYVASQKTCHVWHEWYDTRQVAQIEVPDA